MFYHYNCLLLLLFWFHYYFKSTTSKTGERCESLLSLQKVAAQAWLVGQTTCLRRSLRLGMFKKGFLPSAYPMFWNVSKCFSITLITPKCKSSLMSLDLLCPFLMALVSPSRSNKRKAHSVLQPGMVFNLEPWHCPRPDLLKGERIFKRQAPTFDFHFLKYLHFNFLEVQFSICRNFQFAWILDLHKLSICIKFQFA